MLSASLQIYKQLERELFLARRRRTKIEFAHFALFFSVPALCTACYFDAPTWLQLLILATLCFAVVLSVVGSRRKKFRRSKIQLIDAMSGAEFELHLAGYFREHGYKVEVTVTTGDYGADLILRKGRQTVVVQAKRWSRNVGVSSVQEVIAAKHFYKATDALLICSGVTS